MTRIFEATRPLTHPAVTVRDSAGGQPDGVCVAVDHAWAETIAAALNAREGNRHAIAAELAEAMNQIPHLEPGETPLLAAARDVLAERQRQIEVEGWTAEHDDRHTNGEIVAAAAFYALHGSREANLISACGAGDLWPWLSSEWKKPGNHRRNLVKAAALLIAEIERLARLDAPHPAGDQASHHPKGGAA